MKQVLISKGSGKIHVADVPPPTGALGGVVIRSVCSVISSGTERAAVSAASQSLIERARARPDLVKKALRLARDKGVIEAFRAVRARLRDEGPLGYSLSGRVIEGGPTGLAADTRVVSVGGGYASHAEIVEVPAPLVFRIPVGVDDETAAFTAFGAIAMHGVRTAGVGIGDHVAVLGCGLVGLLTVQLLRIAGCVIYGFDPSNTRSALAKSLGAQSAHADQAALDSAVFDGTGGRGVDAVIITAATSSSEPIETAARLARDRASVVVVGDVGLALPRDAYFAKELSLRISRSYGPGRYDEGYEVLGRGYPPGYVPWTERRNCQEFLRLAAGSIQVTPLISSRYAIDDAPAAYRALDSSGGTLAVLLTYDPSAKLEQTRRQVVYAPTKAQDQLRIGVIGGGAFALDVLLPAFRRLPNVNFQAVATTTSVSADRVRREFGCARATTSAEDVLSADDVDAVVIATRHDSHASYAARALRAGKAVFVEKPLAIDESQLTDVISAASEGILQVGFNRRFSPLGQSMREFLADSAVSLQYRVNAGHVPATHWTRQRDVGGGRIIGEVCHFLDFLTFLNGSLPVHWEVQALEGGDGGPVDTVAILLDFGARGIATLNYVTTLDSGLQKERIEGFATGRAAVLEDFRTLELLRDSRKTRLGSKRQDKGFSGEVEAFVAAALGRRPVAMTLEELRGITALTFQLEAKVNGARP